MNDSNWRTRATLTVSTAVLLLVFQNCGGAKFSGSSNQSSSSGADTAAGTAGGMNAAAGGTASTGGATGNPANGNSGSGTNTGSGSNTGSGINTGTGSNNGSGTNTGTGSNSGSGTMTPNCGNKILVNGKCVDFSCRSVVAISAGQLQQIPARTAQGVCYAYHIFSAIPNSASNLTPQTDSGVMSANHDVSGNANHHPYLMASFQSVIQLLGPRVVKLAGALDATSPILVDNFLLYGVFPAALTNPDPATYYKVSGTADSAIFLGNVRARYVLFDQAPIVVTPFAPGGTSSIAPIDISTSVPAKVSTMLDIRAEDCGSIRQLSDIYLLFQ